MTNRNEEEFREKGLGENDPGFEPPLHRFQITTAPPSFDAPDPTARAPVSAGLDGTAGSDELWETSRRIDLSERFCEEWDRATASRHRGLGLTPRPRIEDYLEMIPPRWRPGLTLDLLTEELRLRRRDGEVPEAEDYRDRFPDYDAWIKEDCVRHRQRGLALLTGLMAWSIGLSDLERVAQAAREWKALTEGHSQEADSDGLASLEPGRSEFIPVLMRVAQFNPDDRDLLMRCVERHRRRHQDDLAACFHHFPQAGLIPPGPLHGIDSDFDSWLSHLGGRPARYQPYKLLGIGGMGEIWAARDNELRRRVVIKRLPVEKNLPHHRRWFIEGVRTHARLFEPGLIPVLDAGWFADGSPFAVFPLIRTAKTLRHEIEAFHRRLAQTHHHSGARTRNAPKEEHPDSPAARISQAATQVDQFASVRSREVGLSTPLQDCRFQSDPSKPASAAHERRNSHALPSEMSPRAHFRRLIIWFESLCRTVHYLHVQTSSTVIHRDIKPENVMIGRRGELYLIDLGISRSLRLKHDQDFGPFSGLGQAVPTLLSPTPDPTGSGEATSTPQLEHAGTFGYQPPETLHGQVDHLSPRLDVFGLGATLYHILTNRPPLLRGAFPHPIEPHVLAEAVADYLRRRAFPHPTQRFPWICPRLEAICFKAIAADPELRYQTADELADAVRRWLDDQDRLPDPDPIPILKAGLRAVGTRCSSWLGAGVLIGCLSLAVWGLRNEVVRSNADQQRLANLIPVLEARFDQGEIIDPQELHDVTALNPSRRFPLPEVSGSSVQTSTWLARRRLLVARHGLRQAQWNPGQFDDQPFIETLNEIEKTANEINVSDSSHLMTIRYALFHAWLELAQLQGWMERFEDADVSLGRAEAFCSRLHPQVRRIAELEWKRVALDCDERWRPASRVTRSWSALAAECQRAFEQTLASASTWTEELTQPPLVALAARVWSESAIRVALAMARSNRTAEISHVINRVVTALASLQESDNPSTFDHHLVSILDQLRLVAEAAHLLESGNALFDSELGRPFEIGLDGTRLTIVRERCRACLHRPPRHPAILELLARLEVMVAASLAQRQSLTEARTWANWACRHLDLLPPSHRNALALLREEAVGIGMGGFNPR